VESLIVLRSQAELVRSVGLCRKRFVEAANSVILMACFGIVAAQPQGQPADNKLMALLPRSVPAPKENPTTPQKVALGKLLFFDPRLSGNNTMSCATCHAPDKAFGDSLPQGKGAAGNTLKRNTPSLLNVSFYSSFFWDGREKSLEAQALLPIQAPDEMNQGLDELERELNAVPAYVEKFRAVFGTKVTRDSIAKALASFERTLVTESSPYDRYLGGEKDALSTEAKRGMELFFGSAACARCHQGPLLSDEKFYRIGFTTDKGQGSVTGKSEDNYKFRTPSLRNVARTGPYMHDGSHKTLDDVLFYYLRGVPNSAADGLPLDVDSLQGVALDEIPDLIAFLEALSGLEPRIDPPELP
jgi:cytochrome c peroxidase